MAPTIDIDAYRNWTRCYSGLLPDSPEWAAALCAAVNRLEALTGESPTVDLGTMTYLWRERAPRLLRVELRTPPWSIVYADIADAVVGYEVDDGKVIELRPLRVLPQSRIFVVLADARPGKLVSRALPATGGDGADDGLARAARWYRGEE